MPKANAARWGILALFFVSGAPALLYQIIWQRHLFTIFGAHAESVAIIVGAFMLGLGIGSLVGGEVSERSKRSPFVLFAVIEGLIALFGLFSLQLFDAVGAATSEVGVFAGGVASFLLVVVPTVAMGATLPILAAALIARIGNVGTSVGQLYFVNTLGSAFAALGAPLIFHAGFGQRAAVQLAAGLNVAVICGALVLWRVTSEPKATEAAPAPPTSPAEASAFGREHAVAALLSFCSGFLALSVEIAWFRVFFLFTKGRAYSFPLALACFLFGIAFGSLLAARLTRSLGSSEPERVRARAAGIMVLSGAAISFAFFSSSLLVAGSLRGAIVVVTLLLGLPLGLLFPLLMHAGVLPGTGAGRSVSHIYAANIAGSVAGSVGTGFILLDVLPMRTLVLVLSLLALGVGLVLRKGSMSLRFVAGSVAAVALFAAAWLYNDALFEKLQFGREYKGERFARVVENKSGVIAVTADGTVYGSGVYDGHYSVGLVNDRNYIVRPYSLSAFHADPKRILVIGLASGSWAQVLANHPNEPQVDVVEINEGHLELIPHYPVVASVLKHPRVKLIIEDGRRWLLRHPNEKYDAIIINTSYYWRAGSTNLLSREFLQQLRGHLNPKGLVMFNTTSSEIVKKTGFEAFPYGWRIVNTLIVGDSPLPIDRERLMTTLRSYQIDGKPVFDESQPDHAATLEKLAADFDPSQQFTGATLLENRETMFPRYTQFETLTDDNMLV
ncbi:MAG: spermidine synthase, partial [Myxococcaceae bacterium]|nr:spermidine synthase [Myxococcaceae bacterium]